MVLLAKHASLWLIKKLTRRTRFSGNRFHTFLNVSFVLFSDDFRSIFGYSQGVLEVFGGVPDMFGGVADVSGCFPDDSRDVRMIFPICF